MKLKITHIVALLTILAFVALSNVANAEVKAGIDAKTRLQVNNVEKRENMKDFKASTTMIKREIKASTTEMFKKMKDDRKEIVKKMHKNAFEIRKAALVKQLTMTLENLTNIRARINARIIKLETEGKVMTDAKISLATADDKLAKAKIAVNAFATLTVPAATGTATTTVEVELTKPRQLGDVAIKAVKDARDALRNTNVAIAQNMGLGKDKTNATSTATTTSN